MKTIERLYAMRDGLHLQGLHPKCFCGSEKLYCKVRQELLDAGYASLLARGDIPERMESSPHVAVIMGLDFIFYYTHDGAAFHAFLNQDENDPYSGFVVVDDKF